MSKKKSTGETLKLSIFVVVLLITIQCTTKSPSVTALPDNILGLKLGMTKEEAKSRLQEIAVFERDENKNQQVWKMKDVSRFSNLAVGYDQENKIRYVTGFVDKNSVKDKILFTDVGDISTSKQEIIKPHYRYIWEVPAKENNPAYSVNIYGDNPDFVTMFTLNRTYQPGELKDSDEEEEKESEK